MDPKPLLISRHARLVSRCSHAAAYDPIDQGRFSHIWYSDSHRTDHRRTAPRLLKPPEFFMHRLPDRCNDIFYSPAIFTIRIIHQDSLSCIIILPKSIHFRIRKIFFIPDNDARLLSQQFIDLRISARKRNSCIYDLDYDIHQF